MANEGSWTDTVEMCWSSEEIVLLLLDCDSGMYRRGHELTWRRLLASTKPA